MAAHLGVDISEARPWQAPALSQPLRLRLPPLPPGARFDSQYDVVLLVDQREQYSRCNQGPRAVGRADALKHHAAAIAAQGVAVDSSVTLPCGDVAWVAQHRASRARYLLDFLAERKSYADLHASITDGRYEAQKAAMAGQGGAASCFYILEGAAADLNAQGGGTSAKALACNTSLHRMLLHDGFKVVETGGPADTVDALVGITRILADLYGPCTPSSSGGSSSGGSSGGRTAAGAAGVVIDAAPADAYEAWRSRTASSRRTRTVRQKWQELLLSVAGVGEEAVRAISAAYPTPSALFRAYQAAISAALAAGRPGVAAARALLVGLPQPNGTRLGQAKAAAVYDRLYANGWDLAAAAADDGGAGGEQE